MQQFVPVIRFEVSAVLEFLTLVIAYKMLTRRTQHGRAA